MQHIDKYSTSVRFLHWLMAILFTVIIVMGFVMVEFKESKPWGLYELHKSLGILVFGLLFIRLFMRAVSKAPPLPADTALVARLVAHITVAFMYICMIIMPISGYLLSNSAGFPVKFFGIELPVLLAKNPELSEKIGQLHEIGGWVFVGLITLHILGVIAHHLRGFEVLRRIT
jgi:cytochrome b561